VFFEVLWVSKLNGYFLIPQLSQLIWKADTLSNPMNSKRIQQEHRFECAVVCQLMASNFRRNICFSFGDYSVHKLKEALVQINAALRSNTQMILGMLGQSLSHMETPSGSDRCGKSWMMPRVLNTKIGTIGYVNVCLNNCLCCPFHFCRFQVSTFKDSILATPGLFSAARIHFFLEALGGRVECSKWGTCMFKNATTLKFQTQ
jgi:hypothetical protein